MGAEHLLEMFTDSDDDGQLGMSIGAEDILGGGGIVGAGRSRLELGSDQNSFLQNYEKAKLDLFHKNSVAKQAKATLEKLTDKYDNTEALVQALEKELSAEIDTFKCEVLQSDINCARSDLATTAQELQKKKVFLDYANKQL